jgi:hypothetical protein
MIDPTRDECRLAGVVERLAGRWRFLDSPPSGETRPVDVAGTNKALVLRGRPLGAFPALAPGASEVVPLDRAAGTAIEPHRVVLVLLCGGLGTRSGGQVHPLLPVPDPRTGETRTLIDRQLDRLERSPLHSARTFALASLHNEDALRSHLERRGGIRPRVYAAGLAPRLALDQPPAGAPRVHASAGGPTFNPTGHLDALRWLVAGGMFDQLADADVLVVASYSNVGRLFAAETLGVAGLAAERARSDPAALFAVEVVARPATKKSGATLVAAEEPGGVRLVKAGYGTGAVGKPPGDRVLMSTNTLYFPVSALRRRLGPPRESGVPAGCARFDAAFDIDPVLSRKADGAGGEALQVERDLDQLSLLPGPPGLTAVEVGDDRAVSLKLPADLDDPRKREFLFTT